MVWPLIVALSLLNSTTELSRRACTALWLSSGPSALGLCSASRSVYGSYAL